MEQAIEQTFSGKDTIDTALQLIRYDIPVLILGKSSIGKSYTLIDITEKWRIPHQLLYIGSEKSENIEGIPKLTDRKKDKEILEYLQPYWFPNAGVITESVKNGRVIFENFIKDAWDVKSIKEFTPNYMNLNSILNALSYLKWDSSMLEKKTNSFKQEVLLVDYDWIQNSKQEPRTLNKDKFTFTKDGTYQVANDETYRKDDIADFCAFIRTVLGYGNYWLILDEIDKVSDDDKDKFAPLLHIVRERTLKNFRMIDVNNGKGLGIPLGKSFTDGGYENIIKDLEKLLDAGESVLDTRVMAIANKTKNIEEALFRRFVQLIAEEVMIWRPEDLNKGETAIEGCLSSVKSKMVDNGIESGSLIPLPAIYQRLDEINLQWQYNFFPKILNKNDPQGNFFILNALDLLDESQHKGFDWNEEKKFTAFWQILKNNFYVKKTDFSLPNELWNCLEPSLVDITTEIGISKKSHEEQVHGIVGIINSKIEEIGDLYLAAMDISDNLRSQYPTKVVAEEHKLGILQVWTDNIISYLDASIKSDPTTIAPIDIAKHLVPMLINVFYTEIANDKNNIVDNFIPIVEKFQNFFLDIYSLDPSFTFKCDSETTQTALYGGSKSEINSFNEDEKERFSQKTLFGTDDKNWINSASGKLTLLQMEDGLSLVIPTLVRELGQDDALDAFIDPSDFSIGSIEFLRANFESELIGMATNFDRQSKINKKAGKEIAAQNFYNARVFVDMLLKG